MWKCKSCGETNPDSSQFCQSCGAGRAIAETKDVTPTPSEQMTMRAEREKQNELNALRAWEERNRRQEEFDNRDAFLRENGHVGFYEYKVISVIDSGGVVSERKLEDRLNDLGRQGWHLRCAFTNELGKNATSVGAGGFSVGTNTTHEQNILILERFIKFKD